MVPSLCNLRYIVVSVINTPQTRADASCNTTYIYYVVQLVHCTLVFAFIQSMGEYIVVCMTCGMTYTKPPKYTLGQMHAYKGTCIGSHVVSESAVALSM